MPEEQMSDVAFNQLIEKIRALGATENKPGKVEKIESTNTLADSNICFYGGDGLDEFITAVENYKEINNITDDDALAGLRLLLGGFATTWWKGVRREAKTWQDALALLRDNFSPTLAPYQIYMKIFETTQTDHESLDKFIMQQRALFAKLPDGRHDEETYLDFIYALLLPKYVENIPREHVKSFKELLEKGRNLERTKKWI